MLFWRCTELKLKKKLVFLRNINWNKKCRTFPKVAWTELTSDVDLKQMIGDLKRVTSNPCNVSFLVFLYLQGRNVQKQTDTLDEALISVYKGSHRRILAPCRTVLRSDSGTWYGTWSGETFLVFKSSESPRGDQRDGGGRYGAHVRAQSGYFFLKSCGFHTFLPNPDWFWVRNRRTNERILFFRRGCTHRRGTQEFTDRQMWQNYGDMGSGSVFHGYISLLSVNFHALCTSSREVYPWKSWKAVRQGWKNISIAGNLPSNPHST